MKKRYYSHAVRTLHSIWRDCVSEDNRKFAYWNDSKLFVMTWAGWFSFGDVFTYKFDFITEWLKTEHQKIS